MTKILICDDEFAVLETLRAQIEHEGYLCYGTSSGKEAIVLAKNNDIDLVITDLMMPEFNGLDLAKELCLFTRAKVIVLTGYAEDDLNNEIKALPNFCGLIKKPWQQKELIALIHRTFDTSSDISSD